MHELIETITGTYIRQIFYFALKKTSNEYEADDLTQEIIFEIIKSLKGGVMPDDIKASESGARGLRYRRVVRRDYER